jgi:hypothetical protein
VDADSDADSDADFTISEAEEPFFNVPPASPGSIELTLLMGDPVERG